MENIHWSQKIAQKILAAHPKLAEYVVAAGITPSGSVHIGNFREFITAYTVGAALQEQGKKVRMVFSWDDFDRLRKVPQNITDPDFHRNIGKPVSEVFAERFEKEFEKSLRDLELNEIPIQFRYQSKEYRSGRYNDQIIHALKHRKQIYDIITSFKTQDSSESDRETYYPISVYCETCGKDFTRVTSFDAATNKLEYTCKCGGVHTVDVKTARNIKLVWKVDWPMRWKIEGVIFEPGGPDHLTDGGSYDVASRISREIFNYEPPITQIYGFVGIKGQGVKMSSSKGENITPAALLNIYESYIIRWLFSKYAPEAFFEIGFDDTIIRHYKEFDREHQIRAKPANFGTLATIGPLAGFDPKIVKSMLGTDGGSRLERVKYWLENYAPDKIYHLRDSYNTEFAQTLTPGERHTLTKLHDFLKNKSKQTPEQIQEFLYSIINDPSLDKKQNTALQQRYFKIFYNMLFGRDDGPRLYLYLALAPRDRVLKLIN